MPVPNIGRTVGSPDPSQPASSHLSSNAEELLQRDDAKVLGTLAIDSLLKPEQPHSAWVAGGVPIDLTEAPPPWELKPEKRSDNTNARRFVEVPDTWELRWVSKRQLEKNGWNHWQPVMASDPRVKVLVSQMVDVGNNIVRGSQTTGDVLAWMPRHWVESRARHKAERTARLTQKAVQRQHALKEAYNRGEFGPHVRFEGAKHPTHTQADGRTLEKDT